MNDLIKKEGRVERMNEEERVERKKVVIVGIPERLVVDNEVSYKIPVKNFDENGNVEDKIKYITVSERQMLDIIEMAKEHFDFKNKDVDRAYV